MNDEKMKKCASCGGKLRRVLACDLIGSHVYINKCVECHLESGESWIETHWRCYQCLTNKPHHHGTEEKVG